MPTDTPTPLPTHTGSGGGVIAFTSEIDGNFEIYLMNADGSDQRQLTDHSGENYWPTWSPDGTQIAFASERDGNFEIYVMNADGSNQRRLTNNSANDLEPDWSPDGRQIAFMVHSAGRSTIHVIDVDGSNQWQLTDSNGNDDWLPAWSPDGTQIVFVSDRDGNSEIYVMNADGNNQRRLTDNAGDDAYPAWSPGGATRGGQISFFSERDGSRELYLMDADGGNLQPLTHDDASVWVSAWSPDGTEIAFTSARDGNREIYVIDAGGTNLRRLTNNRVLDGIPAWRPEPTALPAYVPLYEPGTCRFQISARPVECGYLIVPEDRDDPDGPTVSLHVAIFRSTNPEPEPDPVIYLMGGGGGNALNAADYYLRTVGYNIRQSRDFIMFNQRGTHYNQPFLVCPGEAAFQRQLDAQDLSRQEADAREEAFLLDCRDKLLDKGVNLSMYNSVTNAADANDLRIALGYDQVNYYGTSYGTRLALTLMRYHPEGIRSVILDSVFPPQVDYPSEAISSMVDAVNRLFEACALDAACSSQYPDLEATFYQTIDDLQAKPGSITIDGRTVVVDEHVFMDAIYMALHPASALPDIPRAIDAASRGDFGPLKWAIESISGYSENVATGVYYSSVCRDEVGFDSNEQALKVVARYPPQWADYFDLSSFFATCEAWGAGEANEVENEPVVSDIPALVFAGHFDPITTPEWCWRAAETLSNSYYYEFPNMGHGVMRSDKCALEIGLQFLEDPTTEPDTSCMEGLAGPEFR